MTITQEARKAALENKLRKMDNRSQCDDTIQELFEDGRCTQTTRKTLINLGIATKAQANAYIRAFRKKMGLYAKGSGKHFNKSKKSLEVSWVS